MEKRAIECYSACSHPRPAERRRQTQHSGMSGIPVVSYRREEGSEFANGLRSDQDWTLSTSGARPQKSKITNARSSAEQRVVDRSRSQDALHDIKVVISANLEVKMLPIILTMQLLEVK